MQTSYDQDKDNRGHDFGVSEIAKLLDDHRDAVLAQRSKLKAIWLVPHRTNPTSSKILYKVLTSSPTTRSAETVLLPLGPVTISDRVTGAKNIHPPTAGARSLQTHPHSTPSTPTPTH